MPVTPIDADHRDDGEFPDRETANVPTSIAPAKVNVMMEGVRRTAEETVMPRNITQQLIHSHLVEGDPRQGEEIGLRIDQTLTQDATGTLVMLELEAMELDRVRTDVSVQYVDHNLIQEDHKNPDDHLFLESACRRFGLWYSRAGNGVSHPVHQDHFGRPGATLLGSDSHTPAAGALGMLAFGAGGIEVAMAMAGRPFHVKMPQVRGVELTGELPAWVSAKDLALEMLRRHDVHGAVNCVLEYFGPGVKTLSVMDRHVIANMGTEMGATSTVFPSDEETYRYLEARGREGEWTEQTADERCDYDQREQIDLSRLEPLVAMPSSPGNVQPIREVAGLDIYQSYLGSSANPGYRDFAITAEIVDGETVHPGVSFDINPTSRELLLQLIRDGHLQTIITSGARLHQAGCNGCIGMGQAPASGKLSVRTVPRNFPGRSGTRDDQVCLVSPETAAASAIHGKLTDPRTLKKSHKRVAPPAPLQSRPELLNEPPAFEHSRRIALEKGPNIHSLPEFEPLPNKLTPQVALSVGDNISTDEILPAGTRVLPYRSNIPRIAEFAFEGVDDQYVARAKAARPRGGHALVAGHNYGQGSSREHAALAPRYLGLRTVIAKSFARIHWQNLVNFGVLPLQFENPDDYEFINVGDQLDLADLSQLRFDVEITVENTTTGRTFAVRHRLSTRQRDVVFAGGLINSTKSSVG